MVSTLKAKLMSMVPQFTNALGLFNRRAQGAALK
jgi:hypothetical protein